MIRVWGSNWVISADTDFIRDACLLRPHNQNPRARKGFVEVRAAVAEFIQTNEPHGTPIVARPNSCIFKTPRTADMNPILGQGLLSQRSFG